MKDNTAGLAKDNLTFSKLENIFDVELDVGLSNAENTQRLASGGQLRVGLGRSTPSSVQFKVFVNPEVLSLWVTGNSIVFG